ncbi:MAG: glycosyltransferase family 1 protein [Bacteroidetes bacterium HGW-Bacteroidetes-8]|jgi:glycosyltransferase involved in cell wall biosynthesis|nr:MAG: glycosyltransferase family 1 protein [Bacteroidetes bacterium HGW-Bacteroidetes-8]
MYRIGFDAKRAFTNLSGLGNYSRLIISSLSQIFNYNEYFLYTTRFREHPLLEFSNRKNITVRRASGLRGYFSSLWRSCFLSSVADGDKLDLYHGLSGELPLCPISAPKVVTIHDLIFLRYPGFYKPLQRWIYRKKAAHAIKHSTKVIAISKQTSDDIIAFFGTDPSKIEIIYQGCDPQFYTPASPEKIERARSLYNLPKRFIVAVGTVQERKNLENVVRALPSLPKDVQLLCFGKWTPYALKVWAIADKLGVRDRVRMVHDADFTLLPAIYSQAECLVYVSHFEGFGIPVLEGITYGIPVVTSKRASMPEAGGEAPLYVDPSSVEEIAGSIEMVLSSPTLRKSMIERGFEHSKEFRSDKVAEKLFALYQNIISKHKEKNGTKESGR